MKPPTLEEIASEASATVTVPRLIDAAQIAELMRVSPRHFQRLVHDGEFPRPILIGNCARWEAKAYAAHIRRLREETSKRKRHA